MNRSNDLVEQINKFTITKGMKHVVDKQPSSGLVCPSCGSKIPKYQGRYPSRCPYCNTPLMGAASSNTSKASLFLVKKDGTLDT